MSLESRYFINWFLKNQDGKDYTDIQLEEEGAALAFACRGEDSEERLFDVVQCSALPTTFTCKSGCKAYADNVAAAGLAGMAPEDFRVKEIDHVKRRQNPVTRCE
ncbi:hypothetical protein SBOR_7551 [Sclerotinia borealis F-4128]|uniref:Uncharacterized protein n=1 Tax=Sclerotinia borealis (strain F-4128) TaxID=1432307 RepID=W9C870_SCLBF|nr:hypothetical protein SBOR_7551 [Sclerotinia borealis F-4128]